MPPARPASRRGVRCAAGEEVPLGVQIETALMDAFAPRFVGDRARAHPERPRDASPPRRPRRGTQTLLARNPQCFFYVPSFFSFSDETKVRRAFARDVRRG